MQITISGYPLPVPITLTAEKDGHIIGEGFLLDHDETQRLIEAWCDAPTAFAPNGEDDVRRTWSYSELGLFITVLHLDGELSIDHWESAIGSEGTDLYSTTQMPFDFTVHPAVDIEDRAGVIEQLSRQVADTVDLAEHPHPGTGSYEPIIEDTGQLAAFIADGIRAYIRHGQIITREGYTYTPVITEDGLGYVITAPSGHNETVTLVPSTATDEGDGTGNLFLYHSDAPAHDPLGDAFTHVAFTDPGAEHAGV